VRQVVAEVISNRELMPEVHLLWLQSPEIARVAQPGQFVMVRCGDGDYPLLRRPLSIHRTAGGKQIALLFSVVGSGTALLSRCQPGESLDLLGPLGKGFRIHPDSHSLLLIAGGVGIAPLVFLADEALSQGRRVCLSVGAPDASSLYPRSLLPAPVDSVVATEDGSEGRKGIVTDLVGDRINQVDQVFACGPLSMYQTIAAHGLSRGKSVQVSLEVVMGCGLGACYGCTVKTRRGLRQVCQDGPVLELDDLLW